MIAPTVAGDRTLGAWFDAIPRVLRGALVSEAGRLGRVLRDQVARPASGETLSLAVENSGDAVTATLAMLSAHAARPRRAINAPRRGRSHHFRRATAARVKRPGLHAAFVAMRPEIRAGLEMAVRQAFVR
jgi:hypothetical protein